MDSRDTWRTLVHVCRRWRSVVFGSPLRLNPQLLHTDKTPVRECWTSGLPCQSAYRAIKQSRTCMESSLHSSTSIVYVRLSSITFPFPYWKRLPQHWCRSDTYGAFVEPWKEFCRSYRSILGRICRTSARSLVGLCSISGYISPEAMVTCISALTSIETLHVEFRSPQFSP